MKIKDHDKEKLLQWKAMISESLNKNRPLHQYASLHFAAALINFIRRNALCIIHEYNEWDNMFYIEMNSLNILISYLNKIKE